MTLSVPALLIASALTTVAIAQDVNTIGPDDSFQVRYASNLNKGDSFVNITNTGSASEEICAANTPGCGAGNICANVYVFDPAEEMLACCSCLLTPNALVSLSVQGDLISNTLSPETPTAVVIKLVASSPLGGGVGGGTSGTTCDPAHIEVETFGASGSYLVPGMRAWGTTLHALAGAAANYGLTESRFENGGLSSAELGHLTSFCGFINSNGSGFGICKSCRAGGLGGSKQ